MIYVLITELGVEASRFYMLDRTSYETQEELGLSTKAQKMLTLCFEIGIVGGSMNLQSQFDFSSVGTAAGYSNWLAGRQVSVQALARRLNLPVGHEVEVWLQGDVRLKGKLRLHEENLLLEEEAIRHMELQVDRVRFRAGELERCVRLD